MCQHLDSTYEGTDIVDGETFYIYVCHTCQEAQYLQTPPMRTTTDSLNWAFMDEELYYHEEDDYYY